MDTWRSGKKTRKSKHRNKHEDTKTTTPARHSPQNAESNALKDKSTISAHAIDDSGKRNVVRVKGKFRRRLKNTFPLHVSSLFLKNNEPTWSHFLDEYGKGDQDLSNVERPECFIDYGFMAPPEASNESKRTGEVKLYMDKKGWENEEGFRKLCEPILEKYSLTGLSISLLDRTRQVIKFAVNHPLNVISRNVSLDGHAILSHKSFALLDASRDWRTLYNPMVHGPPFIRFYVAVPLVSKNNIVIGALAVFDPFPRHSYQSKLINDLAELSAMVIGLADTPLSSSFPRAKKAKTTGAEYSKAIQWSSKVNNWEIPDGSAALIPDGNLVSNLTELKKLNCNPSILHSSRISQELMSSQNTQTAIEKAAQILASSLGLEMAYIVEIRKIYSFEVAPADLSSYTSGSYFDLEDKGSLGPSHKERIKIRLLGGYNLPQDNLKYDRKIHIEVLQSEYGMNFDSSEYHY